ncbi:unnamed protein product [Blepharisma stoltei]|uniref:Uncharacterized protein n=1 Tax=Blepharisma stoltei TaxID=1481888 RepID=A0AAU9INN5_9CILI|nr:unnamed protein product [Blepharisma stoltei]
MMYPNPRKLLEYKEFKARKAAEVRKLKNWVKEEKEIQAREENEKRKDAHYKMQELEDAYLQHLLKKLKKPKKRVHDEGVQTINFDSRLKHKSTQSISMIEETPFHELRKKSHLYPPIMHKGSDKEVMFVHLVGCPPPVQNPKIKHHRLSPKSSNKSVSPRRDYYSGLEVLYPRPYKEANSYESLVKRTKKRNKSYREIGRSESISKINNNFHSFRDIEIDEHQRHTSEKSLKMKNYYHFRVKSDFEPDISMRNKLDVDLRPYRLHNTSKLKDFKKIRLLELL